MSIYSNDFLSLYTPFLEFAHVLWEATTPSLALTHKISVTRFFRTKTNSPSVWYTCDSVLEINFRIELMAGSINTIPDFFCRLEVIFVQKIRPKVLEDIQGTVTTSSSDFAGEGQFFSKQTYGENETEESNLEHEEQSRENLTDWLAKEEPSSLMPSIKEFKNIDGNSMLYTIDGVEAIARKRME